MYDEEYGAFVPSVEESRLSTHLYEALHTQRSWSNSSIPGVVSIPHVLPLLLVPPADPTSSDRVLPPLIEAPPQRANIWLPPPNGLLHTTLTRQNSIRRLGRSRTAADFNEFTTHRRNLARQLTADEDPAVRAESSNASPIMDGAASGFQFEEAPWSYPTSAPPRRSSSQARRFFPFGSSRRFDIPTPRSAGSAPMERYFPPPPPQLWGFPDRIDSTGGEEDASEERLPRLRRGGLRAPEAMLSRQGMSVSWPPGSQSQEEPSTNSTGTRTSSSDADVPAIEPSEPVAARSVPAEAAAGSS